MISLEVLNDARHRNLTIKGATEEDGRLSYATVMRYVRQATEQDVFGRAVPRHADRLFRPMEVLDHRMRREVRSVYGSRTASRIAKHQSDVGRFLETGDESLLRQHRDERRAGRTLASDPSAIEQAARDGTLDDLGPLPARERHVNTDTAVDVVCRLDYRRRELSDDARCSTCEIAWTAVLIPRRSGVLCYQCLGMRYGKPAYEDHHVGGTPSLLVVRVPANLHRVLTLWQEMTWRGRAEACSADAVLCDLIGLLFGIVAWETTL